MKTIKNEKQIINLIRYSPILFVVCLSIIISSLFIKEKQNELEKEIKLLEETYIEENKKRVKRLVDRVHSRIVVDKQKDYERLNSMIKEEVIQVHSIVESIYNKNKNIYSKEKTYDEIRTALRNIRYLNGHGYFFIYELSGKNIFNGAFPQIEGKNFWEHKDLQKNSLLKNMHEVLKEKDETFSHWYWKKPDSNDKEYKKIGFFKKFEPLNIFIGSGIYVDEIEKELQKNIAYKINNTKFDKTEHVFIYNLDGLCLVNPKKELVGKNRYNAKNQKGEYALRNSLEFVQKEKEGFRYYNATVKLDDRLQSNGKISYLKFFEDWNWMIGSGFYLEGLHKKIAQKEALLTKSTNKSIREIVYLTIFLTFIFILISFYLSKQLEIKFEEYKLKLQEEVKNSYEKEKLLIQQSKMATMGEMLGSIAHQWKQPLSLLSLSNGLIRISRETKDMFDEKEVDEAIDNIDNAIKNLNQTVDDFRNFFNPNKERTLFKVSSAVRETLKLISSQLRNNNIKVIQDIKEVELYGSQNELQQVLINLLKNSKEELVKKESAYERFIFINTKKENNNLIISIKDSANGIKEEIIEKIFEAYFTTKEKIGGSGIGLYMCRQIVEGHMKGQILAKNINYTYNEKNYKGAEFIISIPLDLREEKRQK